MKTVALKKLLVANRGEIALRIIRSARVMGLKTVAVFSEADAAMAHVAEADEARPIGPAPAAQSYLNIAAILEAARASGADAIHPGYGFLSERPEFARAVAEAGLTFVGPPAEAMAAIGDKVAARRVAIKAGVPVVPGSEAADLASATAFAREAGLPILVKASAGGGGRGMRIVEREADLEAALGAASREAEAAFGDGRVFLEKYLARPRHIEVQLLGDRYGKIVALGERECSIQRRHQKIIEESPSPAVNERLRARMLEAAIRLASAVGYRGAGTVEFLLDGENFYFLEVNARLQVEHPITEIRFGCDLVCEQLKLAAGYPALDPSAPRGHAIECRICAEDAEHDFRPATGRVLYIRQPGGPGVRFDTFLGPGVEISAHYDSLLAKLICFGEDREQARRRSILALDEFALLGVTNTAAFLREIVASEAFGRADLSTHFIEENFPHGHGGAAAEADDAALIAAAMVADRALGSADGGAAAAAGAAAGLAASSAPRSPWTLLGDFRLGGRR
ncbi:MAG: biotin carboxylase N-terminal domain-containing protein [Candidatus Binataceae bacterium]|jgi:acetyl/propionyl-CoA carboxylase alpha subunit